MTQILQRSALILLATSALAACSTSEPLRPNFPIQAPPPAAAPPAPPPPVAAAPVEVAPLTPPPPPVVESAPLPPPVPYNPLPTPAPRPPAPAYTPPAYVPPPAPTWRTVTKRTTTGRVVSVGGKPVTYEVKRGDGLAKIARKLDTTPEQLAKDNKLKKPYRLQPGDTLKGPASTAKAYVANDEDTLAAVAKRFSVSVEALRDENDLGRNPNLRSGQRLRLPDGYRDRGPSTTTSRVQVTGPSPRAAPPAAEPDFAPEPEPSAAPSYRTSTERTVTGRVIEVPGKPVSYQVKKGDSLARIAEKLDTTIEDLAKDNRLKKPYVLRPGRSLKGPSVPAKAYVVGQGDTLFAVAKRFSLSPEALRGENGLSRNASIRSGQRLRLPRGYRDRGPVTVTTRIPVEPPPSRTQRPSYTPPPAPPAPPINAPRPYTPPYTPPQPYVPPSRPSTPVQPSPGAGPVGGPVAAPPLADAQISQLGRGRFIWPLRGELVSDFGPKATGQRNDGVNIRAAMGDAVRAAAAGDVVYAGDQVPGFGNLVLIKHADGWVTAYGHLSRVDVKMQQRVAQGQQVGLAGATGGAPEPQLHFEVRYAPSPLERARPIDPTLVLPR